MPLSTLYSCAPHTAASTGSKASLALGKDPQLAEDDAFMDTFGDLLATLEQKLHKAITRGGGVKGDRSVMRLQTQLGEVGLLH